MHKNSTWVVGVNVYYILQFFYTSPLVISLIRSRYFVSSRDDPLTSIKEIAV